MKKLYLLILFPFLALGQDTFVSELKIDLINYGGSYNITFLLTSIGARWDENNDLTEDYATASAVVNGHPHYAAFDHVKHPSYFNDTFAVALYRISAIENSVEQAEFYCDWRTSDWSTWPDVYFKYDVGNKHFKNEASTQIIDHSYQTFWDLTDNLLVTSSLEDYWDNCLVAIPQKNPSTSVFEPFIIWGPYNGFQPTGYKIYWRRGETGSFTLLQTLNSNTYTFRHENLEVGQGFQTYYKVKAYNGQYEESDFTNIASISTSGWYQGYKQSSEKENPKLLYSLEQNYPNPFNPSTIISWQSPIDDFVTLKVYDILGRQVALLVNEYRRSGTTYVEFDASTLPSGIYLYNIQIGKYTESRKLTVQK